MKNTILIHGAPYQDEFRDPTTPSPSNTNWFPWLQKQIALHDEISVAPEMPRPYDGVYSEWESIIKQYAITQETVLIGHSCGGGFLLRFLSENPTIIPKKVILVAPWLDPEPHELTTPFFDFKIDEGLSSRIELHFFMSSDDFEGCLKSFDLIKKALPNANYHMFDTKGHFTDKEFPEIIEVIQKLES